MDGRCRYRYQEALRWIWRSGVDRIWSLWTGMVVLVVFFRVVLGR